MTAYFVPTSEQREEILESFTKVGPRKAIGYLPLRTISKILRLTVPAVEREFAKEGRIVLALGPDECRIGGGAVYVFDQAVLRCLLTASKSVLSDLGWPTDPESFVRRIAVEWLDETHPIVGLVHTAFGDSPSSAS